MTSPNEITRSYTVTAFYDSIAAAQGAMDRLIALDIPKDAMRLVHGQAADAEPVEEKRSFWDSLRYLFLPEEDRHIYAEGLKRGGYLVSVQADEAVFEKVVDILDSEGIINLTEQEGLWRSEGWHGYDEAPAKNQSDIINTSQSPIGQPVTGESLAHEEESAVSTGMPSKAPSESLSAASPAESDIAGAGANEESVFPAAEKISPIGRREDSGRVQVYAYSIAEPLNASPSLLEEKSAAERQGMEQPVMAAKDISTGRAIELGEYTDKIHDHMNVMTSDGQFIGVVDHLEGDRIMLTRDDSPDNQEHGIPLAWVKAIGADVELDKPANLVRASW